MSSFAVAPRHYDGPCEAGSTLMARPRNLVLVLGDQLSHDSAAFDGFDGKQDVVWMAEVAEEAEQVLCHKLRIAAFFSAMRHFRDELRDRAFPVRYAEMSADRRGDRGATFADVLKRDIRELRPAKLVVVQPGDFRVKDALQSAAASLGVELEVREDRHFYCSLEDFNAWADTRPARLLLEAFYEYMRKRQRVLVDARGKPEGGRFSLDADNRKRFSPSRAGPVPPLRRFPPDATSRAVIALVEERFAKHSGSAAGLDMPVTRADARAFLDDFLEHRLPRFGPYEDAMWTSEPFLFHSRLSLCLNLKLLDPRECVQGAVTAYERQLAPLQSVEGFVRQILGWR